jgi:hypothetical protein
MEPGVALHCPMSSKNPRLHFIVNAFVDDVVALVEAHFGVALFDRHPAFGGGACTRRLRCATGECCGDEDEHQNGDKIAGLWGRRRAHVAKGHRAGCFMTKAALHILWKIKNDP